ncbi:MAG TPA: proton-conducting transporter membrane subunit [Bauldia sp.]|nr:proton-conducting transporter membrane subunit [Bauldia sp.]
MILVAIAIAAWLLAALLALTGAVLPLARALLVLGALALILLALVTLPGGTSTVTTPLGIGPGGAAFALSASSLWLLGFGLVGAAFACWLGTPSSHQRTWIFGAAMSLVGALGVFGMQDAVTFLVAWELMSLGGALMILGERLADERGRPVLFMLALLEVGSVALVLAFIVFANASGDWAFAGFAHAGASLPTVTRGFAALMLLVGFGAKLGLLPFYEWFPGAYGAGSGATGALLSGVILNAAFFALARGLVEWLPPAAGANESYIGIFIVAVAVISTILTALYAFQQEAWRELLSLSSAENGSIAVCLLGIALMFRQDGLADLSALALLVALVHLAGHALAKGGLFLAADGVFRARGNYALAQSGVIAHSPVVFGVGALFVTMSLAAMPPQAGFVSEWYLFQTVFQGFHLVGLPGRLTAALAGAGLALTAAIAFATFLKAFGIGLLGDGVKTREPVPPATALSVGCLGLLVLVLAVGMPVWLTALAGGADGLSTGAAADLMHDGWLLVPLTSSFAFISPSKLIIAMPLLALLPLALVFAARRRWRAAPVWYGGEPVPPERARTTALTFSNALRTFYSFVYRPQEQVERDVAEGANGRPYFIRRLTFTHDVAPIFGPLLFVPIERLVDALARRARAVQSGHLNIYLATIGILLVIILALSIFV